MLGAYILTKRNNSSWIMASRQRNLPSSSDLTDFGLKSSVFRTSMATHDGIIRNNIGENLTTKFVRDNLSISALTFAFATFANHLHWLTLNCSIVRIH